MELEPIADTGRELKQILQKIMNKREKKCLNIIFKKIAKGNFQHANYKLEVSK